MIDVLDRELVPLDRELRAFAARRPGRRALSERLYGVGPVAATAILAELGDCRRFTSSDDAVRHPGLDVTVSPDHEYFLQVRERTDHKSASLSVARKLCRRAYHIMGELGEQALAPNDLDAHDEEAIRAAA